MKTLRFAAPLLSLALLAGPAALALHAATPAPAQDRDHDHDQNFDGPPSYTSDIARRGWHDGMQMAQADFHANRPMDPYHTMMFRRPPVAGPARQEYRSAYLRGYDMTMHQSRGWGYRDNNGWHDEHDNWRENHENYDNEPHFNPNAQYNQNQQQPYQPR